MGILDEVIDVQKNALGIRGPSLVTHPVDSGTYIPTDIEREAELQARKDKAKGFIAGMGGWNGGSFLRHDRAAMPAAPPPQWGFAQGIGPVWQTPERIGATTQYQMVNNAPGTPGFYGGGNRI